MRIGRVVCITMMLVLLLSANAFALSSGGTVQSNAVSMGSDIARSYEIKFGKESKLGNNDSYPIYSAPDLNAVRGANGKASLHTSGGAYSAGWNGAWLLMRYEKNNGGYRVGWVPKTELNMRGIERTKQLDFAYWTVTLDEDCILTDDPLLESEILAYAAKGESLTYLAFYQYNNGREYAYVQGDLNGKPVCGFIPFEAIAW